MAGSDAYLAKAWLLYEQDRYEMAENLVGQALSGQPENAEAYALLALCRSHQDQHVGAQQAAEQAIGLEPDVGFLHFVRSCVLAQDERWTPVTKRRARGIAARPLGKLESLYLAMRPRRHKRIRLSEAMASIDQAIELDPYQARFHCHRAYLFFELGSYSDAEQASRLALEIDPNDPVSANLLAAALRQMGRVEEAETVTRQLLPYDPEGDQTHTTLGWTLLHRGYYRQAAEHFREALRLDPGNTWARDGLFIAAQNISPIYRVFKRLEFWWDTRSDARKALLGATVVAAAFGLTALGKVAPVVLVLLLVVGSLSLVVAALLYLLGPRPRF